VNYDGLPSLTAELAGKRGSSLSVRKVGQRPVERKLAVYVASAGLTGMVGALIYRAAGSSDANWRVRSIASWRRKPGNSRGDRACSSSQRDRVSAACELRPWAAGRKDTGAYSSEAFYVVAGRLSQRTPQGVMNVEAGHSMNGHSAGMTVGVFNSGPTELAALIMFVVDATKPFSVPAKFE
jgi:hypothetical protein